MALSIDAELERLPNIHLYPALSAAKGRDLARPVDVNLLDEAEMIRHVLYANRKSTLEQRTALLKLKAKLDAPPHGISDQPPWEVLMTRMETMQTSIGAMQTSIGAMQTSIGEIKTSLKRLDRMEHASKQMQFINMNRTLSASDQPMQRVEPNYGPDGQLMTLPGDFVPESVDTLKLVPEKSLNAAMTAYGLALPRGRGNVPKKIRLLYIFLGGTEFAPRNYG